MSTDIPTRARVLVVDDHAIVRHGLTALLNAEPDLMCCGEAATVAEALDALERLQPDAAIVDITLKDENGLDVIREARARQVTCKFLVLSMHDELTHGPKAVRAGAQGYVMKEHADEDIAEALRTILRQELYLSESVQDQLLRDVVGGPTDATPGGPESLTDREREIFRLVGQGLTSKRIAEQLGLSARTVEVHRAHIKRKLGCADAAQLVREAVRWVENKA